MIGDGAFKGRKIGYAGDTRALDAGIIRVRGERHGHGTGKLATLERFRDAMDEE